MKARMIWPEMVVFVPIFLLNFSNFFYDVDYGSNETIFPQIVWFL